MKLGKPQVGLALVSALAVLFVGVIDAERTSPGPLATVHGTVEELAGKRDCRECHGGWTRSMASACLDCHTAVAEHIESGAGLHGRLERGEAQRCAACHSDHHGECFAIVNRQSFALAGVPDAQAFEHELVGFAMGGKHVELGCVECHSNADVGLLPAGEHRFLGLAQNCATCHDDPHAGRMQVACADCHAQESFEEFGSAGHERNLPLFGGHGDVSCRTCHAEGDRHSLEAVGGRGAPPARKCADCHESPHATDFVANVAGLVTRAEGASCVVCHAADHATFSDDRLFTAPDEIAQPLHACSGFALDAPHAGLDCAACHAPAEAAFDARYPGRAADACRACHEDPHAGQFEPPREGLARRRGADCLACHERHAFEPPAFGVAEHALAGMPLTGSHVGTECSACHTVPSAGAPRVFRGTPQRCGGCHDDAHKGFFDAFLARDRKGAAEQGGDCAQCHSTADFAAHPPGGFDHARWTDFALLGAHAQADCESCHPRSERPDAAGRTFGRVVEHFGDYTGCATCHEDPHDGRFDGPASPRVIDGRADCARCHVQTSFRALEGGFDHLLWTGFELKDAHAKSACTACHAPVRSGATAAQRGRTLEPARGTACEDCHADPHAGQFEESWAPGRTDCASCHESTLDFGVLAFNHELDARFPLGEAHQALACAQCHEPEAIAGAEVVRFKPLGMECADCHEVESVPLRRRRGGFK